MRMIIDTEQEWLIEYLKRELSNQLGMRVLTEKSRDYNEQYARIGDSHWDYPNIVLVVDTEETEE